MARKYQNGTESKKHMCDARNDDYSDYGNIGPTRATSGTPSLGRPATRLITTAMISIAPCREMRPF